VAWWSARRLATPIALLRLLPYGTVIVAAFVPPAAGLYLLTSTTWTVVERAMLRRDTAPAA
jgi:YidC/Oxa1 family membrane protein insertase